MKWLTPVADFLAAQHAANRAIIREAFRRKYGFTHAAGTAIGSKLSRTPRRAAQRAKRKAERLRAMHLSQHNPAGAKLIRRTAKVHSGLRMDYAEALEHHRRKMTSSVPS